MVVGRRVGRVFEAHPCSPRFAVERWASKTRPTLRLRLPRLRPRKRSRIMTVKIVLVDVNSKMVDAWRTSFEENPEVTIVQGSMLDQAVDAWVSPTNSRGHMGGGLDAVIKKFL